MQQSLPYFAERKLCVKSDYPADALRCYTFLDSEEQVRINNSQSSITFCLFSLLAQRRGFFICLFGARRLLGAQKTGTKYFSGGRTMKKKLAVLLVLVAVLVAFAACANKGNVDITPAKNGKKHNSIPIIRPIITTRNGLLLRTPAIKPLPISTL